MPTISVDRSGPSLDSRLFATPAAFCPARDDHPAQSADGLRIDPCAGRILIVDDNPHILNLVAKIATRLGYRSTTAGNGVDALHYLTKGHYDLVITDYDMPFLDGYQLADQIKEEHFGTKVIIMIDHCEKEVIDLFDGSGVVDGLLLKPFNLNTMKEKIERVRPSYAGK